MRFASPIPHKKARIEIIPLIDIMFFLLASFMMVSLSQVHMKGMKVNLPTGVSGETQNKKDYISLSVDRDGYLLFRQDENGDRRAAANAASKCTRPIRTRKCSSAVIAEAIHGNVIRLLEHRSLRRIL